MTFENVVEKEGIAQMDNFSFPHNTFIFPNVIIICSEALGGDDSKNSLSGKLLKQIQRPV